MIQGKGEREVHGAVNHGENISARDRKGASVHIQPNSKGASVRNRKGASAEIQPNSKAASARDCSGGEVGRRSREGVVAAIQPLARLAAEGASQEQQRASVRHRSRRPLRMPPSPRRRHRDLFLPPPRQPHR